MKHSLTISLLFLTLIFAPACGNSTTLGEGFVVVQGLESGDLTVCADSEALLRIAGSGFLSEHGNEVLVRFTATEGTPFDDGTSATQEVTGTALSNTLLEAPPPSLEGAFEVTITVILPGLNEGTSPPINVILGGQLVGPFANFDSVTGIEGNVPWGVAAPGVLANDDAAFCVDGEQDIGKPSSAGDGSRNMTILQVVPPPAFSMNSDDAIPGVPTLTTAGGIVTIQADGSYVYTSPLGYTGQDQFTYWVGQPGRPENDATVVLTVGKAWWFINDSNPPGGDGSFADPFDSLAAFNAVQGGGADSQPEAGDCIFVYASGSNQPYDEGIQLLDRQDLLGNGVDLVINGQTLVAMAGRPVITNTGIGFGNEVSIRHAVVLANENTVRGLDIDSVTGSGIIGTNVTGPTTIDEVQITSVGEDGIRLTGITGIFTIGSDQGDLGRVSIQGARNGIFIGGTVSVTGADVSILATNADDLREDGINASNTALFVDFAQLGLNLGVADDGIQIDNNDSIARAVTVQNTNIFGLSGTGIGGRGIAVSSTGSGTLAATLQSTFIVSAGPTVTTTDGGTTGSLVLDLAGLSTLQTTTANPTMLFTGSGTDSTIVRSWAAPNQVVSGPGTGPAGGIVFDGVTFDASGEALGGTQVAFGGNGVLTIGSAGGRVQGTALRFLSCTGDLLIPTLSVAQTGGIAAGFENTGMGLALTITTTNIN